MFARAPHLLLSVLLIGFLTACGGGGGSSNPSTPPDSSAGGDPPPPDSTASVIAACTQDSPYQCSGSSIIRTDNGIAMTAASVQAYGTSTNDLTTPIADTGNAYGLAPAVGGTAEVRLAKSSGGNTSGIAILLDKLGISWDNATDRPLVIETFRTTQSRIVQNADGSISAIALPNHTDLDFYDFANKGTSATQKNYANNVYFPRTDPIRCDPGQTPCPTIETEGVKNQVGDWRSGGDVPDRSFAQRLHSDGDLCAGDGLTVNGVTQYFNGCNNGPGTAYPGFKGYRAFENWGYQYGNLTAWLTQDTVNIVEFAGGSNEHNKNRRGMVAFGAVTAPDNVPTSGTATYIGTAYGWYANGSAATASNDVDFFRGDATITVNFSTRTAVVMLANTTTYDAAATPVPATMNATTTIGAAGGSQANYLTGAVTGGVMQGGVSGRFFGPAIGASNSGPAELGGAFTLSNATTKQTAIGGFIARKQ